MKRQNELLNWIQQNKSRRYSRTPSRSTILWILLMYYLETIMNCNTVMCLYLQYITMTKLKSCNTGYQLVLTLAFWGITLGIPPRTNAHKSTQLYYSFMHELYILNQEIDWIQSCKIMITFLKTCLGLVYTNV